MTDKNFYSIQALRALAVVLVMCFHFKSYINQTFQDWGDKLFLNGDIGVDLFFVISGFVIYYITHNDNGGFASAKLFFLKRFCRVFPPYFAITLLVAGNSIESWLQTAKSLLFIPLDITQPAPWFGVAKLFVGWTLNYEFIFYTLFTLCMLFRARKNIVLFIVVILAVAIPALINNTGISPANNYNYPGYLAILTNSLMLEFVVGAFTAWLVINKKIIYSKTVSYGLMALSFALFLLVVLTHCGMIGGPGYILASFALVFTLANHESLYSFQAPKAVLTTGKISFSLYLVHYRAKSLLRKGFSFNNSVYGGITMFILLIVLSYVLAFISYYLLEKKLSSLFKKYLLKKA
ncbi:acyltransferase [Kosakonia sp. H02]|nr:acyltransferase [Kosakonia sp. H02]